MQKVDLLWKKLKKLDLSIFWSKMRLNFYIQSMIFPNFDKQTKKLAWSIVAKDFKLKDHWDLKKFTVLKKHLYQIYSRGWQKGPPPSADRVKGLQNCRSSKLAHTSRRPGIKPGPGRPYRFHWLGSIPRRREVCANFDELQFWSSLW